MIGKKTRKRKLRMRGWKRGKFVRQYVYGPRECVGYLRDGLAVGRGGGNDSAFDITHIPTGCVMFGRFLYSISLAETIGYANRLLKICDWTKIDLYPSAKIERAVRKEFDL